MIDNESSPVKGMGSAKRFMPQFGHQGSAEFASELKGGRQTFPGYV